MIARPLLIMPEKLRVMVGVLAGRIDLGAPGLGAGLGDRPEPLASRP